MTVQEIVQAIIQEVSAWDGIEAHPHRFGGVEFNLGKVEIGHIHNGGLVDIPFTVRLREALVREREAEAHHLLTDSGWISYYLHRADGRHDDGAHALRLYRLSYLQKRRRRDKSLTESTFEDEMVRLNFGESVRAALG